MAKELTDSSFGDAIANSATPVLVDFYATWCGPCAQQTPILEKWAGANQGKVEVAKVNVDNAPDVSGKYGVMSIPTLLLFKGGKEVARAVGVQSEKALDALLAKA